jgi:hypothetical protein
MSKGRQQNLLSAFTGPHSSVHITMGTRLKSVLFWFIDGFH